MFSYFNMFAYFKNLGKLNYTQAFKFTVCSYLIYDLYGTNNMYREYYASKRRNKGKKNTVPQQTDDAESPLAKYIIQTYPSCEYKDDCEEENEQELFKKFTSGQVFVKTFHNNRWAGFAEQLQDLTKRPPIRVENNYSTDEKPVYKYVHLKDEIIICRSKEEELKYKKNKHYTHTKKSSVSWISPRLCTVLFTSGMSEGSETIGLVFNVDDCIIKAMFLTDADTTQRQWKSYSKKDVEKYRRSCPRGSLFHKKMTFDNFKWRVNASQPRFSRQRNLNEDWWYAYGAYGNEVLAQLNVNAVIGVVYTQNTMESKEAAIDRQKEIKEKFLKDVPIIYYDADHLTTKEKVKVYTEKMQRMDQLSFQLSRKQYQNEEELIAAFTGTPLRLTQDFNGIVPPEKKQTVLEAINLVNHGLINRSQAQAYIENICKQSEAELSEANDTGMRNSL